MITDRFPSLKGLILDMDGVLWKGEEPIIDFPYVFNRIDELGLQVVLATNNATKQVREYIEKVHRFGVDLSLNQVITSAEVTATYLSQHLKPHDSVYVVGTNSLKSVIASAGFHIADEEDRLSSAAVIVGLDPDINYSKLSIATLLIRGGALFVATNPDLTLPTPQGQVPGAGAIISAIRAASGQEPIVIGKPSQAIYQAAFDRMGLVPSQLMGVGDRLETDVLGAQRSGCLSGVVLSGISTSQTAEAWRPKIDVISQDLARLLDD